MQAPTMKFNRIDDSSIRSKESLHTRSSISSLSTTCNNSYLYSENMTFQEIRLVCSILLQWPKSSDEGAPADTQLPCSVVFPWHGDDKITDPMKREASRLWSIAIIPIQTLARRFIARRRFLKKKLAVLMIQSYVLRWITWKQHTKHLNSSTVLQAIARKWSVQRSLISLQSSAINIQRVTRGYIFRMKLCKVLYNITLLQSYVRMRIAREEAIHRICLVVQIQAAARGYLSRRRRAEVPKTTLLRRELYNRCATIIQAQWRCFNCRHGYKSYVQKIVIIQCHCRKLVALDQVTRITQERYNRYATIIQRKWLSCHFWHAYKRIAMHQVALLRQERDNRCATVIQSKWRSYHSRLEYKLDLWDIVVIQSLVWRKRIAIHRVEFLRHERNNICATTIQTKWRSYHSRLLYKCDLKSIVIIQSLVWRKWIAMRQATLLKKERCATAIQTKWRSYHSMMIYMSYHAEYKAKTIQAAARGFIVRMRIRKKHDAAAYIQALVRLFQCITHLKKTVAARKIQSFWRGYRWYTRNQASRRIQMMYRRHLHKQRTAYLKKIVAARTIQSLWRGYRGYTRLQASRRIQTMYRRHLHRAAIKHYFAARVIQKTWRGYVCFNEYQEFLGYKKYLAATQIQRMYRGYMGCATLGKHYAARTIQKMWRGHACFLEYQEFLAAREIQNLWKCHLPNDRYRKYGTSMMIEKLLRSHACYDQHGKYLAATTIQKIWRGHTCYEKYSRSLFAALIIQKNWRSFMASPRRQVSHRKGRESHSEEKKDDDNTTWLQGYMKCFLPDVWQVTQHQPSFAVKTHTLGKKQLQRNILHNS